MDNDNKIKNTKEEKLSNQIHKEVMLFLGQELEQIHHNTSDQSYNIEKEFAKTKKQRSPFSMLMLTGCFVVVFGIAFIMTHVISSNNEDIVVSLTEFEDLNLKNLLNTIGAAQSNYDNSVKNRAAIEGDMLVKLKAAEEAYKNDIFVIDSMNLRSKKNYNARVAEAEKKYMEEVSVIHQEYDGKLIQADKEVEEYKKQLSEFDTTKIQAAKDKEKALDSERRVKELEQQKIKDYYEERISDLNKKIADNQKENSESMRQAVTSVSAQYQSEIALLDPTLSDKEADKIIENAADLGASDFDSSAVASGVSASVKASVTEYQKLYDDYKYLDRALTALPQKNSIPKYVAASRSLINGMGKKYTETTNNLYNETVMLKDEITDLNNQLDKAKKLIGNQDGYYQQSYETLMTLARTNAILIFAADYDNMPVYVAGKARYLITEDGADAEFKAGKTIKGKIFKAEDGSFYFSVALDKEGNLLPVKFEDIQAGTPVKILSK